MTKLLRLTNYQLLGLLIGVPSLISLLLIFLSALWFVIVPVILIFWFGLYFGWHWTLGINLHKKLNEENMLNINAFKFLFIFMIIYVGLSIVVPFLGNVNTLYYKIFSLLNFIGSLSFLYCVGFIAKTLNSVEQNKIARFKDWIGDMILIILFPVGIFVLQPRINQMFASDLKMHNS